MLENNFLTYSGKIIFQILGEILYFPIWWYSVGLMLLLKNLVKFWRGQEKALGFSIWLKNIFVPMYGQRDMASRIISFIMRLIQIIFRGAVLLVWFLVVLFILVAWLLSFPLLLLISVFQFLH
ncbi:MAG: hypothetical protein WC863_02580 [Patescibacteria group bacterium]